MRTSVYFSPPGGGSIQSWSRHIGSCLLLLSAFLASGAMTAHAQVIDLTTLNAEETVDGVIFRQNNFDGSTGTGVFQSFVRIQADPAEEGHNSSGRSLLNDENSSPSFTRDLPLSSVPLVSEMGIDYRQFRLDINQTTTNPILSMDELVVMTSASPGLLYGDITSFKGGGTVVFDLDAVPNGPVLLNYLLAPGSGNGDMVLQIPDDDFTCGAPCFVYIWSRFGDTNESNDGFEEWSVRKQGVLGVGKNATPSFTRTYTWEVTKDVDRDAWDLFTGDTGTSDYDVEVDQTVDDDDFAVTGVITIANDTENRAFVFDVAEMLAGASNLVVDCGSAFPIRIDGGNQVICSYSADLPDGTLRTNEVEVEYGFGNNANQADDELFYETATASVDFTSVLPTVIGSPTVDVVDSYAAAGTLAEDLGGDNTFSYSRTFACDGDEGTQDNTVQLLDPDDSSVIASDDASVTVNCYSLTVEKDATPVYTRSWDWDITKVGRHFPEGASDWVDIVAADLPFIVMPEQSFDVEYGVTVSGMFMDDGHSVSGTITISNPAPIAADLTGVIDALYTVDNGSETFLKNATVELACAGSSTVPAASMGTDGELTCMYTVDLDDDTDLLNRAVATLQNYDYASDGTPTAGGTTDFSGEADVDFGDPTTENDECVDVEDDQADPSAEPLDFGQFCGGDPADFDAASGKYVKEFTYQRTFSFVDPDDCGPQSFTNIASFESNDGGDSGNDDFTVSFDVVCEDGCTLTQGYWKTHSMFHNNGKHYDATWALIDADAEDDEYDIFFLSEQSYIEVMWTPPQGNVYYNLAHQYIAALLNTLKLEDAATMPDDVLAAFNSATGLLGTHTPAQIAALKGKPSDRELKHQFISLAGTLAAFNEGDLGPGHCDDSTGPEEEAAGRAAGSTALALNDRDVEQAAKDAASEDATTEEVAEAASIEALPTEYGLDASYPNPFRSSTTIAFRLPEAASVTVQVYDLLGREVARVVNEALEAGTHRVRWDARDVASGTYIVHFRANEFVTSQRITVTK